MASNNFLKIIVALFAIAQIAVIIANKKIIQTFERSNLLAMTKKLAAAIAVLLIFRNCCFYNIYYFEHKSFTMVYAMVKIDY